MPLHRGIKTPVRAAVVLFAVAASVIAVVNMTRCEPPEGWLDLEFPAFWSTYPPGNWTAAQLANALYGLRWDFLFLLIYPLLLWIVCGQLAQWTAGFASRTFGTASRAAWIAGPTDLAENAAMYLWFSGMRNSATEWVGTAAACIKWSTLAFVGFAILVGAIAALVQWVWRFCKPAKTSMQLPTRLSATLRLQLVAAS